MIACFFCSHLKASKSIFIPRSITTDNIFELAQTNYAVYHHEAAPGFMWFGAFLGMKSTNKTELARYFLPNCKACVKLDESGNGDIDPLWFSLISPKGSFYTSQLCLCPERTVIGGLLGAVYDFTERLWISANTTIMKVNHNVHIREYNRAQLGTIPGFATACDGLNNPTWTAGTLPCCSQTLIGIDDIQWKVGFDFYKCDTDHATLYVVGTIPTGQANRSEALFEPIVGSNHAGIGFGFDGDYQLLQCDDSSAASIMADLKYLYALHGCERRSFDLCANGDWSRYLLVVTQAAPLNSQPGINLLTLPVDVTPGSLIDLWLAFHYEHCNVNYEIGYDFWWHQKEKLCKKCPIQPGYGIQTLALCGINITSASTANISQAVAGSNATVTDVVFTPITDSQLNLNSGTMPRSLSNTIYGSVAWEFEHECDTLFFALNASYEFGAKNALAQWAFWATFGGEF